MDTMYWQLDYRANTGWKRKYIFTERIQLNEYISRYLGKKDVEIKNLSPKEVEVLEKLNTKFQVIPAVK